MTITADQLDELEAKARAATKKTLVPDVKLKPQQALHLVAVYRAALAWSEVQCRAFRNSGEMIVAVEAAQRALHAALAGTS